MDNSVQIDAVTRKRKERAVEVVVFQDPSKKSKENSVLWQKERARPGKRKTGLPKNSKQLGDTNEKFDFKSMLEDVKDFGVTGFSKKERKKIEEKKLQSLGARKPKGEKIPYPILQYAIKKRKENEKERLEMEKAMGIVSKKKKERKQKQPSAGGWWVDKPVKIERPSNNVKLKSSDIKAFQKKLAG